MFPHPVHIRDGKVVGPFHYLHRYHLIDSHNGAGEHGQAVEGMASARRFLEYRVDLPGEPQFRLLRERYTALVRVLDEVIRKPIAPVGQVVPTECLKIMHSLHTFHLVTGPGELDDAELHALCGRVQAGLPDAWPIPRLALGNFDPLQRLSKLDKREPEFTAAE